MQSETFAVTRDFKLPDAVTERHLSFILKNRAIPVFDFDGVISSDLEDRVYRLPEFPGERTILDEIAKFFSIDETLYDTQYLRHLVYQAILCVLGDNIGQGPFLTFVEALNDERIPYYILTARSSPHAVARLMTFCEGHQIRPQELFCVGRVGKGRQLNRVAPDNSGRPLIYFEDSHRHVVNSSRLRNTLIRTVHVQWVDSEMLEAEESYRRTLDQFASVRRVQDGSAQPQFSRRA